MAIRLSSQEDTIEATHEINVTPFIDVMLVLLIVFMVAAPLSTVDVNVDLPASTAQPAPRPNKPLFLTVKPDLSLTLGDAPIERSSLGSALDSQTEGNRDERVFVRADKVVPYGEVMEVMNLLRTAGYLKIGLVGIESAQSGDGEKPQPANQPETRPPEASPAEPKP